jgi:hypothetical protein
MCVTMQTIGSDEHISFHVKHIVQAMVSTKHMSNTYEGSMQSEKSMNEK